VKPWGKPYGVTVWDTPDGPVRMFRRANRVRFVTDDGRQVGPEQSNVVPALVWMYGREGWVERRSVPSG